MLRTLHSATRCRPKMPASPSARRGSRLRLTVLLGLLTITVVWALYDMHSRHARTEWQRPVEVAVALVELGTVDPAAMNTLRARFPALETRVAQEYHRYGGHLARPIKFTL